MFGRLLMLLPLFAIAVFLSYTAYLVVLLSHSKDIYRFFELQFLLFFGFTFYYFFYLVVAAGFYFFCYKKKKTAPYSVVLFLLFCSKEICRFFGLHFLLGFVLRSCCLLLFFLLSKIK